jgi:hypothetical protein
MTEHCPYCDAKIEIHPDLFEDGKNPQRIECPDCGKPIDVEAVEEYVLWAVEGK